MAVVVLLNPTSGFCFNHVVLLRMAVHKFTSVVSFPQLNGGFLRSLVQQTILQCDEELWSYCGSLNAIFNSEIRFVENGYSLEYQKQTRELGE